MELDDHKGNIGHGAFEVFSMKIWNKRDALFSHEFSAFDLTRSLWRLSGMKFIRVLRAIGRLGFEVEWRDV